MPGWLKDAVFYEIYPQSYCDSNSDGIGDFQGIITKLDYIKSLGCNALWINPCFDSPFRDAGYDVRDYKKAADRYGTNEDLIRLFQEAHARGIHVLLDLVPGHTSEEHEWFQKSCALERNEYSDRFIWTDYCFRGTGNMGYPYVGGEAERPGTYLLNFFKCQPALNYGWLHADENWKCTVDSEAARSTIEAIKDVMRFWMDRGCDGFRVDMASSLVKGDDEKKTGTSRIWREIRNMLDQDYPECALVSEWSNPSLSLRAGFHADFVLNEPNSPYSTLVRDYQNHAGRIIHSDPCFTGADPECAAEYEDHSFFKMDAGGDITCFMDWYLERYQDTKDIGYMSLITCNHDTVRPSFNLSERELKLFYAFLFTMPGVPFLYYGDEIGQRYQNLRTKEGGYFRTGSRTPMQWSREKNLGFSDADAACLYLPVDPAQDAPVVSEMMQDADSLLGTVRSILALRHKEEDLQGQPNLEVLYQKKGELPFVYRRGNRICAVNPSSKTVSAPIDAEDRKPVWQVGAGNLKDGVLTLKPQSFIIL
ncbi:MAG TPA: glycosylase [Lachnospiraceae bacterium]|nr:glycosylase [Lachnospiraceae bacterium]